VGLDDLDTLAEDEDIELRRHNHERRLRAVLEPTLASLSPAERHTLEYAALLPPDHIPLPWLRTLATRDFPELANPTRFGDPWDDLVRRLIRPPSAPQKEKRPMLPRCHRLCSFVQPMTPGELPSPRAVGRTHP
jgi:hypothetical protein